VTAWAAEGKEPAFKKLKSDELGRDDIKVIWLMAYTGHVAYPLELRLTDLEIRSGAPIPITVAPPVEEAPPPPAARASRMHLWLALVVFALILCVAAAILGGVVIRRFFWTTS
jgi:hypothetical protein